MAGEGKGKVICTDEQVRKVASKILPKVVKSGDKIVTTAKNHRKRVETMQPVWKTEEVEGKLRYVLEDGEKVPVINEDTGEQLMALQPVLTDDGENYVYETGDGYTAIEAKISAKTIMDELEIKDEKVFNSALRRATTGIQQLMNDAKNPDKTRKYDLISELVIELEGSGKGRKPVELGSELAAMI